MKITGYSDKISVRPGETIQFTVNCEPPSYEAEVVRIICGDTNPAGPGVKEKVISTPVNGTYVRDHGPNSIRIAVCIRVLNPALRLSARFQLALWLMREDDCRWPLATLNRRRATWRAASTLP